MLVEGEIAYWETAEPVWGLIDVALGRWPMVPTTIYLLRNRDRSGVIGVLYPNGHFLVKRSPTTGCAVTVEEEQTIWMGEVVWDGAQPCPISEEPIGWWDEEETLPIFTGHSKGILLGPYSRSMEYEICIGGGKPRRTSDNWVSNGLIRKRPRLHPEESS